MMKSAAVFVLLFPALLPAESLDSLSTNRPVVQAARAAGPIKIDGALSEPAWGKPAVTDLKQSDPVEGAVASESTKIWIAYDDEAVYVAARMYEPSPDSIHSLLGRRDVGGNYDVFAFFVDPYCDRRSGFFFGLTPAGTFLDGTLYNDDWNEYSWDGVWEGKTKIDSLGWTAEMRIPFSQLRFHKREKYVWGVNFERDIARKNERDFLVFTPKNGSGFVSRFADLEGIENITIPYHLEILPYVTTKAEYTRPTPANPFNDGSKLAPGMGADFKVGLGSDLTLVGTVNPDFGQVEVDPAVVNLSDVETFFDEKRPFFIEGSSNFNFGSGGANSNWGFNWPGPDFFYTRRVGRAPQGGVPNSDYADVPLGTNIVGAAKLVGKVGGKWNVGTIQALTSRESARLDTGGVRFRSEVEPLAYYGVFRSQREFKYQSLGFLSTATARKFSDARLEDQFNRSAFTFGLDGWSFLDKNKTWVLHGWAGASQVRGSRARLTALQQNSQHYFQRPDAGHVEVDSAAASLTGYAGRVALNKQKGNFYVNSAFGFLTPKFDVNDLGFQFYSDILNAHWVGGYRWTKPGKLARRANVYLATFRSYNFDGDLVWNGVWSSAYMQFRNYYGIDGGAAYNPRTVNARRTRGGPLTLNPPGWETWFNLNSDDRKKWIYGAGVSGSRYNPSWSWSAYINVEWKPASNLSISAGPGFDRGRTGAQFVGTFDDSLAVSTFGKRYVFAALDQTSFSSSIRVNWTFTPTLSLQFYGQPLISSGHYHGFKELSRPRSYDFLVYGEGGSTFSEQTHTADPDGAGPADPISLDNPDFNFKSLRGNAVLRWEYRPGSTFYLVWTQNRSDVESIGDFQFRHSVGRLFDSRPDNIFLVKLAYWLSP